MSYKKTLNWIGYFIVIVLICDFMTHLIAAEWLMKGKSELDITSSISVWPKLAVDAGGPWPRWEDTLPGFSIHAIAGYKYDGGRMKHGASSVNPIMENGQVELYQEYVVFYDELTRLHYVVHIGRYSSLYLSVDEQGMAKYFPRLQPHDAMVVIHTPITNLDYLHTWGLYSE